MPPPLLPPHLDFGDTIGLVSPASAPPDPRNIDRAMVTLEHLGFKTRLARNARKRLGFLAGTDRERAADLMQMFADRKIKAILCIRGGYGAARLLARLDYALIRANPKAFIGYSDITSLHCALGTKAGLVTFHGPVANSDLARKDLCDFTVQGLLRTVMQRNAPGSVCQGYEKKTVKVLQPGLASGPLTGGNLSLLCATVGTPYQPRFKNRILFLEDVREPPYRFDRMLTHLLHAGLLQQVAGVAIGINRDCADHSPQSSNEYRQSLEDVFRDRLLPLQVPIVSGLPFGHIRENATLPLGVQAVLDANRGDLVIAETAVT